MPFPPSPRPRLSFGGSLHAGLLAAGLLAAGLLALFSLSSCIPDPPQGFLPVSDLRPPLVLEAGPAGESVFLLRFDEEIEPVEGSFLLDPGGVPAAEAEGDCLRILFPTAQEAGRDYLVSGEVEDGRGNGTRFLFKFVGWNPRPAGLRISEVQTGKNSSTLRPHRDFVEFEVVSAGNLGGIEFLASSAAKTARYRFPAAEVGEGELVLLHAAPEGLPAELDELGAELGLSGGIDSSAGARDLWSAAGGLPDENGVLALYERPGGLLTAGLFYADEEKSGPLGQERLGLLVEELVDRGVWSCAGLAAWEDAFRWKPSASRSIQRRPGEAPGAEAWGLSASGAQSPGRPNAGPEEELGGGREAR